MPEDETPGTGPHESQPTRLISRLRALANFTLLVAGLLFVIGWLVVMGAAESLQEETMRRLSQGVGTIGFIAFVAFITSIISIIIENRTGPQPEEEETA